jgi:hypothetical protein
VFLETCLPHVHFTRACFLESQIVGDSHEGPLDNQGKPAYIRKKQTQTNLKTRARQTHGPTTHQTIGLATLGRNSASLERYDAAPVQLRLARGPVAPSGEVLPRSRVGRPLERDSASLGGWTPPRARPRLDRELSAPSSKFPSRSRESRARRRHTCSPGRGI